MADQLVGEAQRRVDDALLADQDAVVQPAAVGEPHRFEGLDLLEKPERPRRRDRGAIARGVAVDVAELLFPDRRRVFQAVADFEVGGRFDAQPLVPLADPIRAVHLPRFDRCVLLDDAGALQRVAEFQGRAVQNRDLALHLDEQIGHAVAVQGRQKMLDGSHAGAVPVQAGRVAGRLHVLDRGGDRDVRGQRAEHDPAPRRQRMQDGPGPHPGVQPAAVQNHALADRACPAAGRCCRRRAGRGIRRRPRPIVRDRGPLGPERTLDGMQHGFQGKRLLDEIRGPELGRAHRGLDGAVPRNDDDRQRGMFGLETFEQRDTVHVRHPHVQHDQPRPTCGDQIQNAVA